MNQTTSDLEELRESVEAVRAEKFPDLSPDLVREIIDIESAAGDDRAEAGRKVAAAIQVHLSRSAGA